MAAISKKTPGLFQFHFATLLVGNAILSGLLWINIKSTAVYSAQIHRGWPFKFVRYDGYAPDSPFLDIVCYHGMAADALLWLTILLLSVVLVESRSRNIKVADVKRLLLRFRWTAWCGAITAAIVFGCINLLATEREVFGYEYGWPFKFSFFPHFPRIIGIRYLVLNLYLASFMSLLTLVLIQYFFPNKKEHP